MRWKPRTNPPRAQAVAQLEAAQAERCHKLAYIAYATLTIVAEQYRLGGVSQLALIDAQRQHLETWLALTRASAVRLADSAALLQALGGGWWRAQVAGTSPDRAGVPATTSSR